MYIIWTCLSISHMSTSIKNHFRMTLMIAEPLNSIQSYHKSPTIKQLQFKMHYNRSVIYLCHKSPNGTINIFTELYFFWLWTIGLYWKTQLVGHECSELLLILASTSHSIWKSMISKNVGVYESNDVAAARATVIVGYRFKWSWMLPRLRLAFAIEVLLLLLVLVSSGEVSLLYVRCYNSKSREVRSYQIKLQRCLN